MSGLGFRVQGSGGFWFRFDGLGLGTWRGEMEATSTIMRTLAVVECFGFNDPEAHALGTWRQSHGGTLP